MCKECLPEHLRYARHTDWLWPFSLIPRSWNAACGKGPMWIIGPEFQSKPIPDPGFKSAHNFDKNGDKRVYRASTNKNGYHIRRGWRFDDVDGYYNHVIISFGYEYDKNGNPI